MPPFQLDFDDDTHANYGDTRHGDDAINVNSAKTEGGVNKLVSRSMEAVVKWEEERTTGGAVAALAAAGRLLAGDPLSIKAMHLKGVALHMLGRYGGLPCITLLTSIIHRYKAYLECGNSVYFFTPELRYCLLSCALLVSSSCKMCKHNIFADFLGASFVGGSLFAERVFAS